MALLKINGMPYEQFDDDQLTAIRNEFDGARKRGDGGIWRKLGTHGEIWIPATAVIEITLSQ